MDWFRQNILALIGSAWCIAKRHRRSFVSGTLVAILVVVQIFPKDAALMNILSPQDESAQWAKQFSFWGDFYTGTFIIGAILWLAGFLAKKQLWKRTAIACVLAAALAGGLTNCFRLTLGRPRPSAGIADGFYGLKKDYLYHSFPSGHAATAFGTAATIAVAMPPLGVPALAAATGVAYARIQLKRHYLSDVLVGGIIGIFFGFAFGRAAKKTE